MDKAIFLVGPTAVGKTEAAVNLAKKINGEIISCDSMQVYRRMPLVSNQPGRLIKKTIPYHLVGLVSPAKEYNVSLYRKAAIKKIKEIINRGKIPIFAGGTGLYMSVVIDGIFNIKAENKALRERLYQQAEKYGSLYLHNKLKSVDPRSAEKIHPNDTKRIIRALEVFEGTGKPISFLQKQRRGITDEYDVRIFCLNMDRTSLYKRIEQRIDKMFEQGLIEEVKKLLKIKLSRTAAKAIGVNEIKGYLDGEYSLEQAKQKMVRNTCLYVKRQLTWFRKDKRIIWISISDKDKVSDIVRNVLSWLGETRSLTREDF